MKTIITLPLIFLGACFIITGPSHPWKLSVDEIKVIRPAVGCIVCSNRRATFRITGSGAVHYKAWQTLANDTGGPIARNGIEPIHVPFLWHHYFHAFREEMAATQGFTIYFAVWDAEHGRQAAFEQRVTFTYEGG